MCERHAYLAQQERELGINWMGDKLAAWAKSPTAALAACRDSTAAPAEPAGESGEGAILQGADAGEDGGGDWGGAAAGVEEDAAAAEPATAIQPAAPGAPSAAPADSSTSTTLSLAPADGVADAATGANVALDAPAARAKLAADAAAAKEAAMKAATGKAAVKRDAGSAAVCDALRTALQEAREPLALFDPVDCPDAIGALRRTFHKLVTGEELHKRTRMRRENGAPRPSDQTELPAGYWLVAFGFDGADPVQNALAQFARRYVALAIGRSAMSSAWPPLVMAKPINGTKKTVLCLLLCAAAHHTDLLSRAKR